MAYRFQLTSSLVLVVSHLYRKTPDGPWYYRRRIPAHARPLYPDGQTEVRKALKTKDASVAAKMAESLARADDIRWSSISPDDFGRYPKGHPLIRQAAERLLESLGASVGYGYVVSREGDAPTDHVFDHLERKYGSDRVIAERQHGYFDEFLSTVSPVDAEAHRLYWLNPEIDKKRPPTLSEAAEIYLSEHKRGREEDFIRTTHREINSVIEIIGDRPIAEVSRDDAKVFRDRMVEKMKTTSVRRRLNTITAIVNRAIVEKGLNIKNPFADLKIISENKDSQKRIPFSMDELKTIQSKCVELDDDIRHIVSLLIDTGMRVSEAVGLRLNDLHLATDVPYVHIVQHDGRRLKNDNSERKVPLVGTSLWAAERALKQSNGNPSGYLFPRYFDASSGKTQGTHASNTINKWLRDGIGINKTSHSFRHSMRDRLREALVDPEVQNAIGGWGSLTVGQKYGTGHGLKLLQDAMSKVVF